MKTSNISDYESNTNDITSYLNERNKKYYRGHNNFVHPLYENELKNSITAINNFLNLTILKYAYFKRLQTIYNYSAEKCFNNKQNSYSYSEAEICEELIIEKDVIMTNLKDFTKEVEVRIQDLYEKQVRYEINNNPETENFSIKKYEDSHRRFLLRLNYIYRYYYYYTAKRLFLDSLNQ